MIIKNEISEKEARQVIDVISAELKKRGKQAIIAVADSHGELMAFIRMENTKFHSITLAINKAYTAARAQKPTSEIAKGHDIALYCDPKYTAFGGGVPIKQNDIVIGGVGVSGLTQEEDEELAMLGANGI